MIHALINTIYNIDTDRHLRVKYDRKHSAIRIANFASSLICQFYYLIKIHCYRFKGAFKEFYEPVWCRNSKGLVALFHGLHGDPAAWYNQLTLLKANTHIDCFAPIIKARGLCSLDEAVEPLIPIILDWAKKHPYKPICLLGVSNGSRIAMLIETILRKKAPKHPVFVSTISGIHHGSYGMNLLEDLGIAKWLYPKVLIEELKYKSEKAKDLIDRVIAPTPLFCANRSWQFFATPVDLVIPNLDSSLPLLNKGETHHISDRHGHDSIVASVAKEQIESCYRWIDQYNKKN